MNQNMQNASGVELRPDSLGVAGIVFFVVAAASPLSAAVGASPAAVGLGTGPGSPSAYLMVGVLLLLFSVGYAAMSRFVPAGGGFAAYIRAGLGTRAGRGSGYVAALSYLAMQSGIYGFFGYFTHAILIDTGLGIPWWGWSFVPMVVVGVLAYFDIDVSVKVLGVILVFEVLVLLVVAFAILAQGGADGINVESFTPSVAFDGALGVAMMFAFGSFIGFEATAIYSEEARDRDRTIPRSTYIAVAVIMAFLVFNVWTFVLGHGVDSVQQAALDSPDNFVLGLSTTFVGSTWTTILTVLLVTSFFAALLAFQNTVARYLRSLSLTGWAPAVLARTHPQRMSPHVASVVTSVVTMVVVAVFAIAGLDPYTTLFAWLIGLGTIGITVLQALTSVAVITFFRRIPDRPGIWRTFIAPALGGVGLVLAVVLIIRNWSFLVGADSGLSRFLPWLIPAVLLIGAAMPVARGSAAGPDTRADEAMPPPADDAPLERPVG
ncbi:APC family permease [Nitriliruptor alkaliphilus]|uniref:APC family permease n=1 Tax=Nitriliruptor alkaliphilus TaxID=427918 RepID=UPI0006988668|nr:APC family permease [Nitriliruptor alkaliphilus]